VVTCAKKLAKIVRVVLSYASGQTDKQTHSSQYFATLPGEVHVRTTQHGKIMIHEAHSVISNQQLELQYLRLLLLTL